MRAGLIARRGVGVARSGVKSVRRQATQRRLASLPMGSRLHLGCGTNRLPGWVNIDIDPAVRPDVRLNLRLGLPVPSGSASAIYSEHVLEHFCLSDGIRIMKDCFGALQDGGVLRFAMPDLRAVVEHYLGDWRDQDWLEEPGFSMVDTPAHMLNFGLREWGHQYVYDFEDLQLRLHQAGFSNVERAEWGQSADPGLRGLETRQDSKLVVEARRS